MTGPPELQWHQLTYTSSDGASAAGGWGVKESTPGMPQHLERLLLAGVNTRPPGTESLPSFPSDHELRSRTRRLACRPDPSALLMWHSVAAGPDATGRPGNVFVHAAALEAEPPGLRAIEYWGSPDWLLPYGPPEVSRARLGTLSAGTGADAAAVLDFLSSDDRAVSLEWMLAAFVHAGEQRRTLVVAVSEPDDGALWIATFCHLTAAALAKSVSWSTFERAQSLLSSASLPDVVCVPTADLEELLLAGAGTLLVVDPGWVLDDHVQTEHAWVLPDGARIPSSEWQAVALTLLALPRDQALAALGSADECCVDLALTDEIGWEWPLQAAMLHHGPPPERWEAVVECLVLTPPSLAGTAVVQGLLHELLSRAPRSARDDVVTDERASPQLQDAVLTRWVEQYLGGPFSRPGEAPDVRGVLTEEQSVAAAAAAVRGTEVALRQAPTASPVELTALAELLAFLTGQRLGELDPHLGLRLEELAAALRARQGELGAELTDEAADTVRRALSGALPSRGGSSTPPPTGVARPSVATRRPAPAPAAPLLPLLVDLLEAHSGFDPDTTETAERFGLHLVRLLDVAMPAVTLPHLEAVQAQLATLVGPGAKYGSALPGRLAALQSAFWLLVDLTVHRGPGDETAVRPSGLAELVLEDAEAHVRTAASLLAGVRPLVLNRVLVIAAEAQCGLATGLIATRLPDGEAFAWRSVRVCLDLLGETGRADLLSKVLGKVTGPVTPGRDQVRALLESLVDEEPSEPEQDQQKEVHP